MSVLLKSQAITIRDEEVEGANTATRVGTCLVQASDEIDAAGVKAEEAKETADTLNSKLYGISGDIEETIPYSSSSNYVVDPLELFYQDQSRIMGKKIVAIRAYFATTGVISVYKATGVQTASYAKSDIQILNVNATGEQTIYLNTPIVLETGELFGFMRTSDTARFRIAASGSANPIGGGWVGTSNGSSWTTATANLCVGVSVDLSEGIDGDIQNIKKRLQSLENEESAVNTVFDLSVDYSSLLPNDVKVRNMLGVIRYSCELLLRTYPNVKIILAAPPFLGGSINDAIKRNTKVEKSNAYIRDASNKLSTPFVDVSFKCGIYPLYEIGTNHKYLQDGIHPNGDGGVLLGKYIASRFKSIFGENTVSGTLVLMGDSITDNGNWIATFNTMITATEQRNYARSGATWMHTSTTAYDLGSHGGNLHPNNVIWNQINRLIDDVTNNSKTPPDVVFIMAGTNDCLFYEV